MFTGMPCATEVPVLTLALCCGFQRQVDQLELVDLVGELEDELVVDGHAKGAAVGVVEDGDEGLGQLVPQLLLPEVL